MSDRLEDFVRQNRDDFDVRVPDPSVWLKIKPEQKEYKQSRRLGWLKVAAAVAIIFAGFSAGLFYLSGIRVSQDPEVTAIYKEIKETEAYYSRLVSDRYNELKPYLHSSPGLKSQVDDDLNELDQIYLELKNDLNDNVGNPDVVEAMIQQYRMKVEILELLLQQLKEKEDHNYDNETNVSI